MIEGDLAAGTLFIIAAIIMWLQMKRPPRPKKPLKEPQGKPWEMTLIGFSDTVLAFSGFATVSSAIVRFFSRIATVDYRPWATGLTLLIGVIFIGLGFWEMA